MSASIGSEIKAEPNLTPLLDVVFQLITFFMLVVNFSTENYDQRVRLPVAESARPVEDSQQIAEDRFCVGADLAQGPCRFELELPGLPPQELGQAVHCVPSPWTD